MLNNSSIAIIIINWRKYNLTKNCIQSVFDSLYENFKIIIVDNEYQKNVFSEFEKNDKIHIIKNENNEGFARANNQGIKYSLKNGFDYILLLNNDTVIKNNLLDSLIKQSNTLNQKIIQPLILNYDGTKIWNAGGTINNFFGTFHVNKKGESFKNFKSNMDFTDWFTGCCVLIKTEVFNDIGYFDERFFAYYEDVDFSIRLKKMGYSVALMTDSYLQHYESASSKSINKIEGNLSPYVHYLNIRNHILLLKKHSKSFNLIGVFLYQIIKIFSYLIYFLTRFRFNKFKIVLKGLNDAINFKK
ncbi:glycosyltransferase family 2 protein [Flavobacteriales bacterium]|nr:glycosyltransferase family 2 protein [Flavobacteriales bacterium]